MAANYIPLTLATPLSQSLSQALRNLEVGRRGLLACQATMVQCLTGGSATDIEVAFGIPAGRGGDVKAEVDSFVGKFTTDASVTAVMASWAQINAKLGIVV